MDKRGVELSMNVIIIAAIALIVLVVLVLLVTGAFGDVRSGTGCTSLREGGCEDVASGDSCATVTGNENAISAGQKDCGSSKTCCYVPLG